MSFALNASKYLRMIALFWVVLMNVVSFRQKTFCGAERRSERAERAENPRFDGGGEVSGKLLVVLFDPRNRVADPALHVDARLFDLRAHLPIASTEAHCRRELFGDRIELVFGL